MINNTQIEQQILNKINALLIDFTDTLAVSATNFTDERANNMLVVGIDNVTNVNVGLPDFEFTLGITIDSLIADDTDGTIFNSLCRLVENIVDPVLYQEESLSTLFGELPVVGLIQQSQTFQTTTNSNRCIFVFSVFTSE